MTAGELYEITPDGKIVAYTAKSGFNLVSYHGGTPVYPEKGEEIGTVENGMEFDKAKSLNQQINQALLAEDMDALENLCAEEGGEGLNYICFNYFGSYDEIIDSSIDSLQRDDQEYWDLMETETKSSWEEQHLFFYANKMGYEDASDHAKNYIDKTLVEWADDPNADPYDSYHYAKDYLTPDEKKAYVEKIYEREDIELPVDYYRLVYVADDAGFENEDIDKMREEYCKYYGEGEGSDICE